MSTSVNWTKVDELKLINDIQDDYVNQLKNKILSNDPNETVLKHINFTSPTGTGKTKMMIKLINKMPDYFFIVTSLSKGQLNRQIEKALNQECCCDQFVMFGNMEFKKGSLLTKEELLSKLPINKQIIWLRDEGHINTNKWYPVLENRCLKIVNFSATNRESGGIICNFTNTMMLRTVEQCDGDINDTLNQLMKVKKYHKGVDGYNPCAIFRVVSSEAEKEIIKQCRKCHLKFISLVDNSAFDMAELCEDDNCYDVIINKQKIVEGVDIRRAHVIWFENTPNNEATVIQAIGRCRRNALLWRNDIDILKKAHKNLLQHTRQCFVYYNNSNAKVETDNSGEFIMALCPYVSLEQLKPGHTIYVENGKMPNGLTVVELVGESGYYDIDVDVETGFNIVNCPNIYSEQTSFLETHKFHECDHIWELLKNKPIEYWSNLQKDYVKLFNQSMYCATIFQRNEDYIIKRSMPKTPTINPNGTFEFNEVIFNLNTIEDNKEKNEIKEILSFLNNKKYCYQVKKTHLINICVDNDIEVIDINVLHLLIKRVCNPNILIKTQDRLLSIIGPGEFKPAKCHGKTYYVPDLSVTSKLSQDSKLNRYVEKIFSQQLSECESQYFSKENVFAFEKRYNSCLGYCVEYYAKYDAFGEEYLEPYFSKAQKEHSKIIQHKSADNTLNCDMNSKDIIAIRACLLKHKEQVQQNYGNTNGVPMMSIDKLTEPQMQHFVKTVRTLGLRTSAFIKKHCDINVAKHCNPNLSTNHIVGFADVIEPNTIIDIKTTNCINSLMVKQVLTYYLLSTYRSDMHVKNIIIYDSVSEKHIKINVEGILPQKIEQTFEQVLPIDPCLLQSTKTQKQKLNLPTLGWSSKTRNSFIQRCFYSLRKDSNEIIFCENTMNNEHYKILCYIGNLDTNISRNDIWFDFLNNIEWYFDRLLKRNIEASCCFSANKQDVCMKINLYDYLLQDLDVLIPLHDNQDTTYHFGIPINKKSLRSKILRDHYAVFDKAKEHFEQYLCFDPIDPDKSCEIYTPEIHQQECLKTFDKNMNLFEQISISNFQNTVLSLVEDAHFKEIKHLKDCNCAGLYLMVFDNYQQIYVGYSYDIKNQILSHWTSCVSFDKLPTGDSPLSVNSFGPLDCTRIFILPIHKDKFNEATRDITNSVNRVFLLNDTSDKQNRFKTDVQQIVGYYGLSKKRIKKKKKVLIDIEFVYFSKSQQINTQNLNIGDIVFLQKRTNDIYCGQIVSESNCYLDVNVLVSEFKKNVKCEKEKIDKALNGNTTQKFAKKSTIIYKADMEFSVEQKQRWRTYDVEVDFKDWVNSK